MRVYIVGLGTGEVVRDRAVVITAQWVHVLELDQTMRNSFSSRLAWDVSGSKTSNDDDVIPKGKA